AESIVVDLDDVELREREWTQELLVVGDDLRGDSRQLLARPWIVEGIGGHADRDAVLDRLLHVVLAGKDHGVLDGLVDSGLENVVAALLGAADRRAGRERDERLGDAHTGPERVPLPRGRAR